MNTSQHFQKISAGVSLATLAVGFCFIGLMSLMHPTLSGDSIASTAISCTIGGWASMATASVFLLAAWIYWRRYFTFLSHSLARVEDPGSRSHYGFSTRGANIPFFEVNQQAVVIANPAS
jgi:hypothetical protein